ncbi:alpha/beta fold hydrolase [Asticcacaulis sp.]|uniref:alpha/beta hydrolase n=1 Tax=Asticcacaulis sp. TaxID=1872648 RepID=UPI002627B6C4|nr:alpha/beta fold hydrolase [Asticcacaulis sp.]
MHLTRRTFFPAASAALLFQPQVFAATENWRITQMTATDGSIYWQTEGWVDVPAFREQRDAKFKIAFVRISFSEPAPKPKRSAHLVLAGGPGESGVSLVTNLAKRAGKAAFDLFGGDIVGMDQRGTGRSSPNLAVNLKYDLPLNEPGSVDAWRAPMSETVILAKAKIKAQDIELSAFNSVESAWDIDAVRRELGYDTFTVWGRSYGSHLALAYLRQCPAAVTKLVLIGPEGPDHTWKLPSQFDAALFTLARKAGYPSLEKDIRTVLSRLAASPVTVPIAATPATLATNVTIGTFDVQLLTAQAMGDSRSLVAIPAAYARMLRGEFDQIGQLAFMYRRALSLQNAMKPAMDIMSGASKERLARIDAEASQSILGNAAGFPDYQMQDVWKLPDLGDAFRAPVVSDIPVLILAGDLDPRTPIQNARDIAPDLSKCKIVEVLNASHNFDVFGLAPVRAAIKTFLAGLDVPSQLTLSALNFP